MARITLTIEMKNIYSYERPAYGYGTETAYIYSMEGTDGKACVWKTTTYFGFEVEDPDGWITKEKKGKEIVYRFDAVNKGDKLVITAGVKGESEYKGQKQIELTRVKVKERLFKGKTREELQAEYEAEKARKKQEQLDSITEKDVVWNMPYKQYKEHYSDCETVIDSFENRGGLKYITVIIREGRLKESGTRGRRYHSFLYSFEYEGKKTEEYFKAICEETAEKQIRRKYRGAENITMLECSRW